MAKLALLALMVGATAEDITGGTLKITWQDCGDASTHGHVTDLEPKTLTIGEAGTMTGTGTLDKAETGGHFSIDVKASIIHKTFTGDICVAKTFTLPLGVGTVTWNGMKCPIAKGSMSVNIGFTMSSAIPASLASATVAATGTATNGDKLLCMNVQLAKAAEAEVVV